MPFSFFCISFSFCRACSDILIDSAAAPWRTDSAPFSYHMTKAMSTAAPVNATKYLIGIS